MFENYVNQVYKLCQEICFSGNLGGLKTEEAIEKIVLLLNECKNNGNKLIFIGNGGSAAIASHSATDYMRTAGFKSLCFHDASLLTCLGNDYGYEQVFAKPLEILAAEGDILIAISSSGKSANILNAVQTAKQKKCQVITLSGFSPDNPLRKMGNFNFYAPSFRYGLVELTHGIICHSILDIYMDRLNEGILHESE